MTEFDPIIDNMSGQSYAGGPTRKSDPQVICEAMGLYWHDGGYDEWGDWHSCSCNGSLFQSHRNPTFTRPDELWGLLQWLMEREDWGEFYSWAKSKWYDRIDDSVFDSDFLKWLLHPPRLVELAASWIRQKGWE